MECCICLDKSNKDALILLPCCNYKNHIHKLCFDQVAKTNNAFKYNYYHDDNITISCPICRNCITCVPTYHIKLLDSIKSKIHHIVNKNECTLIAAVLLNDILDCSLLSLIVYCTIHTNRKQNIVLSFIALSILFNAFSKTYQYIYGFLHHNRKVLQLYAFSVSSFVLSIFNDYVQQYGKLSYLGMVVANINLMFMSYDSLNIIFDRNDELTLGKTIYNWIKDELYSFKEQKFSYQLKKIALFSFMCFDYFHYITYMGRHSNSLSLLISLPRHIVWSYLFGYYNIGFIVDIDDLYINELYINTINYGIVPYMLGLPYLFDLFDLCGNKVYANNILPILGFYTIGFTFAFMGSYFVNTFANMSNYYVQYYSYDTTNKLKFKKFKYLPKNYKDY